MRMFHAGCTVVVTAHLAPARESRLKPTPRCTSARESILEGEAAGATQSFHAHQHETAY